MPITIFLPKVIAPKDPPNFADNISKCFFSLTNKKIFGSGLIPKNKKKDFLFFDMPKNRIYFKLK